MFLRIASAPRTAVASLIGAATLALAGLAAGGTTPGCIPQDLNGSGKVDGADLGLLLAAWGPGGGGGPADFNNDGKVDGADLGLLLASWGEVPPSACLDVVGISPSSGGPGTVVKIVGTFPNPDPTDYCVVAMDESGGVIPFEVVNVEPDSIKAIVGPYPPGTHPGKIMVGLGDGTLAVPSEPPNAVYGAAPWSWSADGPGPMFDVEFTPDSPGAPIAGSFYGTLVGGDLCVTISGDCPAGTSFQIWPRSHHYGNGTPNDPYVGYDCYIPCVEIAQDSTEVDCATFICQTIQAVYLAHVPPIVIDCTVTPVSGGTKLTLSLPGLDIDWGMFNIVVLPLNACNPNQPCNPNCPCDVNGDGVVDKGDFIAIEMLFGTVCLPPSPCCADLNGDGVVDQLDIQIFLSNCASGPCPPPGGCNPDCPCDINGDGAVDGADLAVIQGAFGDCQPGQLCCTDLNGDGRTDGADVQAWFACNGGCFP